MNEKQKVALNEIRKARKALEAKGAFVDSNAATHLVLALEALTEDLREAEAAQRKFFASLNGRR